MLTWLANLLSSGDYKQTQEEAIKYRSGFSDEMKLTNALNIERDNWRELYHRAVQQRDQAGQDLARMTRDKQLANNQRYQWENDARRYAQNADYWAGRFQEKDSSRSGWEWLYRQKCKQWAKATEEIRRWQVVVNLIEGSYNGIITMHRKELTEERGLREGWEQTAGELQAQVAQGAQGNNNLQWVGVERDAAAPELLEIVLDAFPGYDLPEGSPYRCECDTCLRAYAAIAKARGDTQC